MNKTGVPIAKISRIATIIVFLALIRCISEVFRLHYYTDVKISFDSIKPFLLGGLCCSVALLIMTFLGYAQKHRLIVAVAVMAILVLLLLKAIYL